jgi:hypothetical protein
MHQRSHPLAVWRKTRIMEGWIGRSSTQIDATHCPMKTAAQFISEFFSPLLVPLMAFMGILSGIPPETVAPIVKLLYFGLAGLFSSGLIALYVYYLKHKRVIESTELLVREQRISPLTFAVLSYSFGYLCLHLCQAPPLMKGLMFCYATNSLLLLLITRSWKISMHMAAITASIVALTYVYGYQMVPFYLLIPIVGVARMTMQRQNVLQVIAGGLLGLVMTTLQLEWLMR